MVAAELELASHEPGEASHHPRVAAACGDEAIRRMEVTLLKIESGDGKKLPPEEIPEYRRNMGRLTRFDEASKHALHDKVVQPRHRSGDEQRICQSVNASR